MKKILISLTLISLFFLNGGVVFATQGSCSWHGGVSCSAGADWDGSVICNDGWSDGSDYYSDTAECKESVTSCPAYLKNENYLTMKSEIENSISKIKTKQETMCEGFYQEAEGLNNQSYQSCLAYNNIIKTEDMVSGRGGVTFYLLKDCEGAKQTKTKENLNQKTICLGNNLETLYKYQTLLSCIHPESERIEKISRSCSAILSGSIYDTIKNYCVCTDGYLAQGNQCVSKDKVCKIKFGDNSQSNNATGCMCSEGYEFDNTRASCVLKTVCPVNYIKIETLCIPKKEKVTDIKPLNDPTEVIHSEKNTKTKPAQIPKNATDNIVQKDLWSKRQSTSTLANNKIEVVVNQPKEKEVNPSRISTFIRNIYLKIKFWQ